MRIGHLAESDMIKSGSEYHSDQINIEMEWWDGNGVN